MSAADRVRELVRGIERGDEDVLRDRLADEIDIIGDEETVPQDLIIESMLTMGSAFEDLEYTIRDVWADDGTYILHVGLEGRFEHPYRFRPEPDAEARTVAPTGEEVSGSAVHLVRFDDAGEIAAVGSYGYTDTMREMGVLEYAGDEERAAAEAEE